MPTETLDSSQQLESYTGAQARNQQMRRLKREDLHCVKGVITIKSNVASGLKDSLSTSVGILILEKHTNCLFSLIIPQKVHGRFWLRGSRFAARLLFARLHARVKQAKPHWASIGPCVTEVL